MNLFTQWKEKASQFVDVRLSLAKLAFVERTSNVLGFIIYVFILLFLAIAVLIFLGISLQEMFSEWFDSRVGGAFATLGVYLLLVGVVVGMRKTILNGFAGIFVRMLTAGDDEDDMPGRKIQVKD
jgi:H+/gluconate symporter-like permease